MSRVQQQAGPVTVTAWTEGWPIWVDVEIVQINGETISNRASVSTLHDLRYCIDRVLAQLPGDAGK